MKFLKSYLLNYFQGSKEKKEFDGTLQFSGRRPNGIKNVNQTISLMKCQPYSVTNTILVCRGKYSLIYRPKIGRAAVVQYKTSR